ncbi:MAG TPA: ABC transporter transmembrane domain-containing protein [Armatimonadota bacterium]|nr:ABC transporter transmembrane domain-containing protein [Armatimonadota bacterium]
MKTFLRALRYLTPYWPWQVGALVCAFVVTASSFIWPYASKHLLDDVLIPKQPPAHRERIVVTIVLVTLACILLGEAFKLLRAYLFTRAGEGAAADLRRDLFHHLHRLPMTYFDRRKTGGIMSVLQADVEALRALYSSLLVEMISNLLQVATTVAILTAYHPRLTLIGLPIPIAFGRKGAKEKEIVAAAQSANAHDFIRSLPEGYSTEVGEGGTRLSVGQKQRLAIARASLRDPRLLVLDEATPAQDSESERLVQEAMDRLMEGRTSAHRLSSVLRADRIAVLNEGRVTQTGSHAELLAMGGTYARLYALQFEVALEVEHGTA